MSAGTIKLTNGSTAVVGTGTAFTSDLKSGDVITATVGGIFFTLFVNAVTSNTALTLTDPFTGPTTSGLAWVAVPQLTLNRITAALAAQTAESVRRVLQENANWQAFYSGTGDITVTLPDGTPTGRPVPGPSWSKMSSALDSAVQWRGNLPSTANLDTYGPTSAGQWGSGVANMLAANGFPEDGAQGIFEVFRGGTYGCAQRYFSNSGNAYYRRLSGSWNGTNGPWGPWLPVGFSSMPGYFTGDMNALLSPGVWSITSTVTNGPIPDGQAVTPTGICRVELRSSTNSVVQTFTSVATNAAFINRTWTRTLSGTTWSNWDPQGKGALSDLGLGMPVSQTSGFDWQTASFQNGSLLNVNSANWVNPPPVLSAMPTNSVFFLQVTGRVGLEAASSAWVMITATQLLNNGSRRIFNVCGYGAIGSRVFTTTEAFTTNTTIPIANGGTGSSSPFGTTAGKFVQGNDSRLDTIDGKSGGTVNGDVLSTGGRRVGSDAWRSSSNNGIYLSSTGSDSSAQAYVNQLSGNWYQDSWSIGGVRGSGTDLDRVQLNVKTGGNNYGFIFRASGVAIAQQWQDSSDERVKEDIKIVEDPITKMKAFNGVTFKYKNGGSTSAGYIAQKVREVLPEVVSENHDGFLSMNVAGVGALHHEAILALVDRIECLEAKLGLQPGVEKEPEEMEEQPAVQQ